MENVFVINLKKRTDRLKSITKELNSHGIDFRVWEATDGNCLKIPSDSPKKDERNAHGILGCMTSHLTLIKHAHETGLPYIVVFEDDIKLSSDFIERFKKLENFNYDIFYLGGHYDEYSKDVERIVGSLHMCNNVGGTYGYVMKSNVFGYVIEHMNYRYGSDEFYANFLQKKFKCMAYVPFIVDHAEGESDISLCHVDYGTIKQFASSVPKYISFNKLEKYGRLGNQLFEIASVIGLAHRHGSKPLFPEGWKYRRYFNLPNDMFGKIIPDHEITEDVFHYIPDLIYGNFTGTVNVTGTLQSEKYFMEIREVVKKMLAPRSIKYLGEWSVGIHVRRGDYVNNPNYINVPPEYYLSAIDKYFNDERYVFYVCSDDIEYCRAHFMGDRFVIKNRTDIDDLTVLAGCSGHILCNSTFSWWGAYLSESKKVIRPPRIFDGKLAQTHSENDFWPDGWTVHDDYRTKLDMTFIIPVKYDHPDRSENLDITLKFLTSSFDCEIIVGEQGGNRFERMAINYGCRYISFPYSVFHRTRMLNRMTMLAGNEKIVNWDADILLSPFQIYEMYKMLDNMDFVYPYNGMFLRLGNGTYGRNGDYVSMAVKHDVGLFMGMKLVGDDSTGSVGGAVGFVRKSFISAGMENENFIAYTPEDVERYERYVKLGYKVGRAKNPLYHINHYCGETSTVSNPFYKKGMDELNKIRKMDKKQLNEYVDMLPSVKTVLVTYSDSNYENMQDRLAMIAERSGMFDIVLRYNRQWLEKTKFYHDNIEMLNIKQGAGYWLWKPYIILETMKKVDAGSSILYMDCGDVFEGDIRSFLLGTKEDVLLTKGAYRNGDWTKYDCFEKMDCNEDSYHDAIQVEAGVIVVKNTQKAKKFISEWLHECMDMQKISSDKSIMGMDDVTFVEHRHDQSILTNLMIKRGIKCSDGIRKYVTCNVPMSINVGVKPKVSGDLYDATDVTFIIPVKYDSQERKSNFDIAISYILKHFNTNIIVGEQGGNYFSYVENARYECFTDMPIFYRTKMLNRMTEMAETDIVINHDSDVVVPVEQMILAIEMLRKGVDVVYPYSEFVRVRSEYYRIVDILSGDMEFTDIAISSEKSVGGCVCFNKNSYASIGLENENIIGWGYEDNERLARMKTMGLNISNVNGNIYHMEHPEKGKQHPYIMSNRRECANVIKMDRSALASYIESWKWKKDVQK